MKTRLLILNLFVFSLLFTSCSKNELFKSEKEVKKQLQGHWDLVSIPKYDMVSGASVLHIESWTFDDSRVTIVNGPQDNTQTSSSTYSVSTSLSKAEFNVDGLSPEFIIPARTRNNGSWRIVRLDSDFLIIANDKDGASGLTELEFQKK